MSNGFQELNPVVQAVIGGGFAWALGALGSAFVFAKKEFSQKLLDFMLGFAAGIMIAASFWSLLEPSIEISSGSGLFSLFPAASGFLMGAVFLRILDRIIPHLHLGFDTEEIEGIKTSWKRSALLVFAIALHNIPEGLAIGVVIGAAASGMPGADAAVAALILGMGIHNIPEGMAVSVSLRREGVSSVKSFWYGQLASMVFPFSAVIGLLSVIWVRHLLPYALGFAAGAMIFVVVEEVIPESQRRGNTDLATAGTILGFLVMMILDAGFA